MTMLLPEIGTKSAQRWPMAMLLTITHVLLILVATVVMSRLSNTCLLRKGFTESEFLHIPRQDNTDLEKTFDFCIDSIVKEITVLGATGIRDDLAITNMLLLIKYYNKLKIKMVTDIYTVECIKGKQKFKSFPGQNISLVAVYGVKSVSTKGLKYSLTKQSLSPSGQGVSNNATGNEFIVRSSNTILLFRGHK